MRRVLTALVLAPLALALVFLGPKWLVTVAAAAVALLAGWEFLGLTERCGAKPPRIAVLAALAALFAGNYQWPDQTLIIFGGLSLSLFVCCTFRKPVERVLIDSTSSVFALVYVGLTLIAVPTLREQSNGPTLVVFLLFNVWAGDIVALYVGRMWGKRKFAPSISPNKTWAGAIGSIAGSLLVTGGLYWLSMELAQWNFTRLSFADDVWWYWPIMAILVNVAAQVGDLAESALKRSAGVKDSGVLVPGHGGVLDRIDALLLAAPVLWFAQVIR
ncbi:MAG: phosphatidate cytidylyltransferase [Terracidiphilus sp.]